MFFPPAAPAVSLRTASAIMTKFPLKSGDPLLPPQYENLKLFSINSC